MTRGSSLRPLALIPRRVSGGRKRAPRGVSARDGMEQTAGTSTAGGTSTATGGRAVSPRSACGPGGRGGLRRGEAGRSPGAAAALRGDGAGGGGEAACL